MPKNKGKFVSVCADCLPWWIWFADRLALALCREGRKEQAPR